MTGLPSARWISIAVSASLALGLLAACGGGSDQKIESLTVIAGETTRAITDGGEVGEGPGDLYVFVRPLLDESGTEIGSLEGFAVATPAAPRGEEVERRLSTIQFTLPNGTLLIGGVFEVGGPGGAQPDSSGVTRAILGGTGDYRNASGEATVTPEPNDRVKYVFDIVLPA